MKLKISLRRVYVVIAGLFLLTLILGTLVNCYTPYSGRAFLEYGMAPLSSRINGTIIEVYQTNGTQVQAGTPIFKLDDRNFKAEKQRLLALYETTVNQLEALDFQIQEARENLKSAQQTTEQKKHDFERDQTLLAQKVVAAKAFEQSKLEYQVALQNEVAMAARVNSLQRQRGYGKNQNSELKRIQAEIDIAGNNLDYTVIRAPIDGILSSHQLYPGQAVNVNEKYAVIHDIWHTTVNVDLMEKSSRHLKIGQKALIAFDAIPGEVFEAHIESFIRELGSGYTAPNELNRIEEDTRWIRATGRTRIKVALDSPVPQDMPLATGAKAALTFQNKDHFFLNFLMRCFIRLIAILNYIY